MQLSLNLLRRDNPTPCVVSVTYCITLIENVTESINIYILLTLILPISELLEVTINIQIRSILVIECLLAHVHVLCKNVVIELQPCCPEDIICITWIELNSLHWPQLILLVWLSLCSNIKMDITIQYYLTLSILNENLYQWLTTYSSLLVISCTINHWVNSMELTIAITSLQELILACNIGIKLVLNILELKCKTPLLSLFWSYSKILICSTGLSVQSLLQTNSNVIVQINTYRIIIQNAQSWFNSQSLIWVIPNMILCVTVWTSLISICCYVCSTIL